MGIIWGSIWDYFGKRGFICALIFRHGNRTVFRGWFGGKGVVWEDLAMTDEKIPRGVGFMVMFPHDGDFAASQNPPEQPVFPKTTSEKKRSSPKGYTGRSATRSINLLA